MFQDIPFGKVDAREFLDPCRAIATLQIVRDLRNDAAVQLSSLLSNLPVDIQEAGQQAAAATAAAAAAAATESKEGEKGDVSTWELSADMARDYSIRIPELLLEMNIAEQVQNITTFQDIVERQRQARQQLIHLLVKSRCRFGADEAAARFFQLQETSQKLQKRKRILQDAMELEGLDFEGVGATDTKTSTSKAEDKLQSLEPLKWYQPLDHQQQEADTDRNDPADKVKRVRTESI